MASSPSGADATAEKRRIMKNVVLISIAFLFTFNAFQGLSRLQSSLHHTEGMGVITSSVLYAALVLSCLFLPKLVTNAIGHKWTMPVSFAGYIFWMAANGYAVWGTMIAASILVGLAAAPLWTAQCSYFTKIGKRYAELSGEPEEAVLARFFGIFFMFFQLSGITGSIISYTVLRQKNTTDVSVEYIQEYCGINDCGDGNANNTNMHKPDETTVWTMVGIYIGIAILAVLIVCLLVDRLPSDLRDERGNVCRDMKALVTATAKHLRHKRQLLLIPITMYSGFEQAFYNAEWSKSFITCSLGIWKIGLVTLPFGIVNTIVSFTGGYIIKYTGRLPIFIAGMITDLAIQITLMTWPLDASSEYTFYILSGLWGVTDGIWQTQINALYGCLFSNESEAAFSNYRMWESIGFIIAFAYSNYLCTAIKLYILTSVLIVGMVGYLAVEWLIYKHGSGSTRPAGRQLNVTNELGMTSGNVPERFEYKGDAF